MEFNYPRDIRFQCLRCAICCGNAEEKVRHILLLGIEAKRIAEATSKPIKEFATRIEGHNPYFYEMVKTSQQGKCIFLENKHCTIYPLRPIICKFYPFELKITKNNKHEFTYTEECPGIGKGKKLTKTYFKNLIQQLITANNYEKQKY